MNNNMTATQKAATLSFMRDFPGCQVRDRRLCVSNGIPSTRFPGEDRKFPQLRTKKHDHLAVIFDELENAFVLTKGCVRKNLLKGEI